MVLFFLSFCGVSLVWLFVLAMLLDSDESKTLSRLARARPAPGLLLAPGRPDRAPPESGEAQKLSLRD